MFATLATTLAPMFGGAGGSAGGLAATPDTVTVDTGAITPTAGGGSMNLGGSEWSWVVYVVLGVVALAWLRKR